MIAQDCQQNYCNFLFILLNLIFYFLCFVGDFEIESNKSENKRTPSHSNVFVALELISLLRVLLQHIGCCFITLVEVLIYTN